MKSHHGTSLIEVLISLLLLSTMLLGLDAMQVNIFKHVKAQFYYSIAMQQLDNLINRLQALPSAKQSEVISNWNADNAAVLPQGRGEMAGTVITIYWGKPQDASCQHNQIGQSGCLRFNNKK